LEEHERQAELDRLFVKSYWGKQSKDTLQRVYKRVFPFIGIVLPNTKGNTTKGALLTLIGTHLKEIKELASESYTETEAETAGTEASAVDLSGCQTYYDRLAQC
jgi:hypothetical protein